MHLQKVFFTAFRLMACWSLSCSYLAEHLLCQPHHWVSALLSPFLPPFLSEPPSCYPTASGRLVLVPLEQSLYVIASFPALFIPQIIFPSDVTYQFPEFFSVHYPRSAVLTPFLVALCAPLFCNLFPEITSHFFFSDSSLLAQIRARIAVSPVAFSIIGNEMLPSHTLRSEWLHPVVPLP